MQYSEIKHVVVVLGTGKPTENMNTFKFEGSSLQKRTNAGISAVLALLFQRETVKLILTGGYGEALHMTEWVRTSLQNVGFSEDVITNLICTEPNSLTTLQNATYSCKHTPVFDSRVLIDEPSNLQVWVVSALRHLPRACMLFEAELGRRHNVSAVPAYGGELTPECYANHKPERLLKDGKPGGNNWNDNKAVEPGCLNKALAFSRSICTKPNDIFLDVPNMSGKYFNIMSAWKKHSGHLLHLEQHAEIIKDARMGQLGQVSAHTVRFGNLGKTCKSAQWAFIYTGDSDWYWLVNRWYPHLRVHIEYGKLIAQANVPDTWSSAKWKLVKNQSTTQIMFVNKWHFANGREQAIHIESAGSLKLNLPSYGNVECTQQPIDSGRWSSSLWYVEQADMHDDTHGDTGESTRVPGTQTFTTKFFQVPSF